MNRCKIMHDLIIGYYWHHAYHNSPFHGTRFLDTPKLCTAEVPSTLGEDCLAKSQKRAERGSKSHRGCAGDVWSCWFCFGWSLWFLPSHYPRIGKINWNEAGISIFNILNKALVAHVFSQERPKVCHSLREMSTIFLQHVPTYVQANVAALKPIQWFPNISMQSRVIPSIPIHGYPYLLWLFVGRIPIL